MFHKVFIYYSTVCMEYFILILTFFPLFNHFFWFNFQIRDFSSWNQIQETWNRSHDNCFSSQNDLPGLFCWFWKHQIKFKFRQSRCSLFFPESEIRPLGWNPALRPGNICKDRPENYPQHPPAHSAPYPVCPFHLQSVHLWSSVFLPSSNSRDHWTYLHPVPPHSVYTLVLDTYERWCRSIIWISP